MSNPRFPPLRRLAAPVAVSSLIATGASAHEAWLLTPDEIAALASRPIPPLFASTAWLGVAAVAGTLAALVALTLEDRLRPVEARVCAPLAARARDLGPLALRAGIALMLVLAALGGLPRHGTTPWTQPTLLVPDMQLTLAPGWGWLAAAQIVLGAVLAVGLFTRLAGLALVTLAATGLAVFGDPFLAYAPHFAAPGLMLALAGGGALSLDRLLGRSAPVLPPALLQMGWRLAQVMTGACFVYLAIAYKLTQPTLIIAILEHGSVPSMGLPLPVVALAMTGVEIVCGTLLALGRLTRPVALVLIGAISFLAVTLGETPLFHANLYGMMIFLLLAGPHLAEEHRVEVGWRRVPA